MALAGILTGWLLLLGVLLAALVIGALGITATFLVVHIT